MEQPRFGFARDEVIAPPAQPGSHASKRAAAKLKASGVQGEKARRLIEAIKAAGARGLTDSEIAKAAFLPRQSVCSLRRSAVKRGLIVGIGEREGEYAGFLQTIWRATEKA